MAVSFLEAYRLKNAQKISWDQYIEYLFAHCKGIGHEDDNNRRYGHWDLRREDLFGYSIWSWSKRLPIMKATDTTPFEDVFKTYPKASADEVGRRLEALPKEYEKDIRKILAFLALRDRRADVLKLCLEKGKFPYESFFVNEANEVKLEKDSETFKVLEGSHFRELHPRISENSGSSTKFEEKSPWPPGSRKAKQAKEAIERAAKFDVGGSHPVDW